MEKFKDSVIQFLAVAVLFILIFAVVKLLLHFEIAEELQTVILANQTWGWLFYILLNAVLFCLFIPAAVLGSIAGAVFGMTWGSIFYIFSCMVACLLAFFAARFFIYDRVQQKVLASPKLERLQLAVQKEGALFLCLIRFLPIHATILNLLLAVTRVNLRQFLFSSACMIPEWLAYIYIGAIAAQTNKQPNAFHNVLKLITFILVMVAISYAGRVAQKSLQNAKNES